MNQFIMADSAKCIGCRTCEVACVVSHQDAISTDAFTPRILLALALVCTGFYLVNREHRPAAEEAPR